MHYFTSPLKRVAIDPRPYLGLNAMSLRQRRCADQSPQHDFCDELIVRICGARLSRHFCSHITFSTGPLRDRAPRGRVTRVSTPLRAVGCSGSRRAIYPVHLSGQIRSFRKNSCVLAIPSSGSKYPAGKTSAYLRGSSLLGDEEDVSGGGHCPRCR